MSLLKRVLGSRQEQTSLQAFVGKLKPESICQFTETVPDVSSRAASALSLTVLMTAGMYIEQLRDTLKELGRSSGHPFAGRLAFDDLAVEASAYCHFELLRTDPQGATADSVYVQAMQFTSGLISEYSSGRLPPAVVVNRVKAYAEAPSDAAPRLIGSVMAIIEEPSGTGRKPPDVLLMLGTTTHVGAFAKTMIPGLRESCRRLVAHYTTS